MRICVFPWFIAMRGYMIQFHAYSCTRARATHVSNSFVCDGPCIQRGFTPLMFAVESQNIEVMKVLLSNTDTDMNATNEVTMDRGLGVCACFGVYRSCEMVLV